MEVKSGDTFVLDSIAGRQIAIPVDDIYEDVTFSGDDDSTYEVREDAVDYEYAGARDW
ncbi:MAG: hypothetical protein K8F91_13350 [Candidatus Obscuribacterales bacterium]|nr:hypothetical protein [Candidatus Obscuribacterales bacterium]